MWMASLSQQDIGNYLGHLLFNGSRVVNQNNMLDNLFDRTASCKMK